MARMHDVSDLSQRFQVSFSKIDPSENLCGMYDFCLGFAV